MLMYAVRQEHNDNTDHKQQQMLRENKILMLKNESQHAKRYLSAVAITVHMWDQLVQLLFDGVPF